jgi:hypothetical protein
MAITDDIRRIFKSLEGDKCSEGSVLIVFINLLKKIWIEAAITEQKIKILDLILETLITGRNGHAVLKKLKVGLQNTFQLLPIHLEEILRNIDLWSKQQIL